VKRIKVAVIGGGQNCEHDVSIASAASVAGTLDPASYDVVRLTITLDGEWLDDHGGAVGLGGAVTTLQACDVVLPVVHGPRGEDGTLAALCELAGVPYVGADVRAGALAQDKWPTQRIAQAKGLGTAAGVLVTSRDAVGWDGPVVVKPVAAGSSFGVSLVHTTDELQPALAQALAIDDRVLVEELVVGREIDLAVVRRPDGSLFVGPALEVVVDELFDAASKYDGSAEFRLPAELDDVQSKELEDAAVTMYEALGCAGVARIDFFLTDTGPVLNEVNTMPGMTEYSQVPKMFAAAGLSFPALLDMLVQGALAS
jgi:D-alanine-D-alanine ligase